MGNQSELMNKQKNKSKRYLKKNAGNIIHLN